MMMESIQCMMLNSVKSANYTSSHDVRVLVSFCMVSLRTLKIPAEISV